MFNNVSFGLAFLAGLASFLSPCVLSLVPAYMGYLSGRAFSLGQSESTTNRWSTFAHGLAFILGFSTIFIFLGVALSAMGSVLYSVRDWLSKIGGVVIVIFGLHMTGLLRIPFLEYDLRPATRADRQRGYFSSFLMGVFFSAGWSPCIGPVLGTILTLAVNGASIANGIFLLSAYSLGLSVPFLVTALGLGWVGDILKKYGRLIHYLEIAMGIILIIVGAMLFFGVFEQFIRFGTLIDFGI